MEYAIAIKREFRGEAPADWIDQIRSVEGLTIQGDPKFGRVMIEATDDAITQVKERLGQSFHIEPVIRYDTQSSPKQQTCSPENDD